MSSELVVDIKLPKRFLLHCSRIIDWWSFQKELRTYRFLWAISIWDGSKKADARGLNAAFVDVVTDAFLHYLDLGTQYNSECKVS